MKTEMRGCDDLREWLLTQNFTCYVDSLSLRDNECNWYACRRSAIPARECECNDGKAMQIVVRPYRNAENPIWQSAEVDVTGETGGLWYKVSAYSVAHDELRARLAEIEAALIAAWNAFKPERVAA